MLPFGLSPLGYKPDPPKPDNPVIDTTVFSGNGAVNGIYTVPVSRWYRLVVRASAGLDGDSAGGAGARVEYDLFLKAGWKVLCWTSSGKSCGVPAALRSGSGGNNWPNTAPTDGILGGGGWGGYYGDRCGGGGGSPAGGGGFGGYRGGVGSGGGAIIVYTGDDYTDQNSWLYLLLASGAGGGCGDENSSRSGGASGGAGTDGGRQSQAGLAGGKGLLYNNVPGMIKANNTAGAYSAGRPGVGNVLDVRTSVPKWLGGHTNNNSSTTGGYTISTLKAG